MYFSNKTDKKGFGFEYIVSNMFQSQGYLTRRGIPLQYGIANQDATDIDVLGIMFTGPFQGHRIICDCKNKARSKPYERIFWAKGLGEFVSASSVFVALNRTQWEIIRFASTGGVKVLTSDIISEYANSKPAYGLADASYYEQYEKIVEKVANSNRTINNILNNTKKLYLNENPYLALNISLAYLDEISKTLQFYEKNTNEQNKTLNFLACELTVIVGLQLLCICSDVLGLPEKARREHIVNKITFGELEPKTVRNIIKDAKDLANEIVKASVPKSMAPKEVDFGEITAPSYTESLIGLVERALARPQIYLTMPQLLDFLLFEQGLKGAEYTDEDFVKIFGYSMSDDKLKASRNILSFVREFCGIDWKRVFEKTNINQPHQSSSGIVKVERVVTEGTPQATNPTPIKEKLSKNCDQEIKNQNHEKKQEQLIIEMISDSDQKGT